MTLAEGEKGPVFNDDVFRRAAAWIRDSGKFTPAMLRQQPARDLIDETRRVLQQAIAAAIPVEIPGEITGALENNAFVFSGLKTFHSLRQVGLSLLADDGTLKPFDRFRDDVARINDRYNHHYLRVEYNHALAASTMAARWHDIEKDGDRYHLQYRTANDEKVRAEHQRLHLVTLPPSDPFWDKYLPPNGWNCRCTAVQVRPGKYPATDSQQAIQAGDEITDAPKQRMFRFNPGKQLKIFPDKHPYNKVPAPVKQVIEQIAEETIREKRVQDMIAELPDNLTVEEKTAIATHNLELEKALDLTKGKPMTVEQADKQHANPNHGKGREYNMNCQTCTPAYVLRARGFNVTAKPNTRGSKPDYLSRGMNAWEIWKNPDGTQATHASVNDWLASKKYIKMTEKRWMEYFNETCKETGIYGLSIGWKRGGGHMTVLQRFPGGELRYIEPQHDNSKGSGRENHDLNFLAKNGKATQANCRGIMRIDNKLFNMDFIEIFNK
ncbi:MAG: minor capsid protein [Odoribacteraceae bacterium]|nr:minor capsid protein [Odoribacteraceae bacterium]